MRLLALDTSTEACSVALWQDGDVHAREEVVGREHTRRLLPLLEAVLAESGTSWTGLDALVCCNGPGSFAGVRIGVGLVKGLALGTQLPVIPVSSLALIAQGIFAEAAEPPQVVAAIDARMGEIYLGVYRRDAGGAAVPVVADRCIAPGAVQAEVSGPWVGAGTGWGAYETALRRQLGQPERIAGDALPSARHAFPLALLRHAAGDWVDGDELAPAYLRDRVALTVEEQAQLRKR